MDIIASSPVPEQFNLADSTNCPSWCLVHCPGSDDGAILHMGDELIALATAGGLSELRSVYVNVEQLERPGHGLEAATIRLDDTPMTPAEALALAAILELTARQAMERESGSEANWQTVERPRGPLTDEHLRQFVIALGEQDQA